MANKEEKNTKKKGNENEKKNSSACKLTRDMNTDMDTDGQKMKQLGLVLTLLGLHCQWYLCSYPSQEGVHQVACLNL